jgi:peroxisomal enoyl-CoA hydratase 2
VTEGSARTPESFIGERIRHVSMRVEAGKIAEFASALHDANPAYRCFPAAERIPAPPTFSVVAGLQNSRVGSPAAEAVAIMGLDGPRVLNGAQEWRYAAPIFAGDLIAGTTKVAAVERRTSRQGGSMLLVTLETIWTREDEEVMRETVTIIEVSAQS